MVIVKNNFDCNKKSLFLLKETVSLDEWFFTIDELKNKAFKFIYIYIIAND